MSAVAWDDERAIQQLMNRYVDYTDRHDFAALVECFTETGEFVGAYGSWVVRTEWPELAELAATRAAEHGYSRHFVTNIMIEGGADPDAATARSFVLVTTRNAASHVWHITLTGVYEDELVRVDGRWVFASRRVRVDGTEDSPPLGSGASEQKS